MPRIYNRKGDRAVTAQITIPITEATRDLLERRAEAARMTKTEYARSLLLSGLVAQ